MEVISIQKCDQGKTSQNIVCNKLLQIHVLQSNYVSCRGKSNQHPNFSTEAKKTGGKHLQAIPMSDVWIPKQLPCMHE
jgi:hypothetical protein